MICIVRFGWPLKSKRLYTRRYYAFPFRMFVSYSIRSTHSNGFGSFTFHIHIRVKYIHSKNVKRTKRRLQSKLPLLLLLDLRPDRKKDRSRHRKRHTIRCADRYNAQILYIHIHTSSKCCLCTFSINWPHGIPADVSVCVCLCVCEATQSNEDVERRAKSR